MPACEGRHFLLSHGVSNPVPIFVVKINKPMKADGVNMKENTKEWIQYSTALLMIVSGVVLAFLSFFLNNYDIADGVLWYIAQALTYAGAIFGVSVYFKTKLGEAKDEIARFIRHEEDKAAGKVAE